MRIILDRCSTKVEKWGNDLHCEPTVLEVKYDSDRESRDKIRWTLTADEARTATETDTETELDTFIVTTTLSVEEFSKLLSKLAIFLNRLLKKRL
jgi:hypothetical protein